MNTLKNVLNLVNRESPVQYKIVIFNIMLAIACIPGMFLDDRILMGINVWVKPFKFSISTAIYIFTVGYLTSLYPYTRRKKRLINGFVAWTLLIEMIIIFVQGARGVQSHYNQSAPLDALAYLAMGILIAVNVMIMVLFLFDTIRLKLKTEKSIQWAIFLGWAVVLVGSYVGGQMISQLAHNVGVVDGGEGLPLVNWSTIAGDLRIAHFFGLHGIQIIPLFAVFVTKNWSTSNRNHILAVSIFAILYASWIGFTFYQAKQGMPLIGM